MAVQIVWKYPRGSREIEHLGSAHTQAEVELLQAVAAQRIAAGQDELPLGIPAKADPVALEVTGTRMGRLLDGIGHAYRRLGLDVATGGDRVFEELVTARIIEPTSKKDAARVLEDAGVRPVSYRTVKRKLASFATPEFRNALSGAVAARALLGPFGVGVIPELGQPSA